MAEVARAAALKTKFDSLILTEIVQRPEVIGFGRGPVETVSGNVSSDGATEPKTTRGDTEGPVRLPVLTLYGGGPQPKQLFSSLQQPIETASKVLVRPNSLQEESLPNGISTSKVIPVHSVESSNEKKGVPTLGELFPPAPPPLQPPNPSRQSKLTVTRSSSVNWVKASEPVPANAPRKTYPVQPLATSQWLTYNTVPPPIQPASSGDRRRQRDRALSSGEPQSPRISVARLVAQKEAREDALFRSAYSSFAPDKDSTAAIVPDHSKESIWWEKVGERKYRESFGSTSVRCIGAHLSGSNQVPPPGSVPEEEIPHAVENWTATELPRELMENKGVASDHPGSTSDMDTLIGEISELLETLNSYQRVRNLSLTNNGSAATNPELIALSGNAATPSAAEFDVYSMLQSQLATIISTLPPYAVAKLDGQKLGLLNTTTKIPVEGKNYVGTMEEDELAVKPRTISTSSAVGYPPRTTSINSVLSARSNGYTHPTGTPTQPIPRSTPGATPRAGSMSTPPLPNQQYSSRPASSNHYFSGTAHSSYPPQRAASMASERHPHPKPPQYGPRPAQPSVTPLPNGYRAYPSQNGLSSSQHYTAVHHGPSSPGTADPASKGSRPSAAGYPPRAMNAHTYPYATSGPGREPSPSKNNTPFTPLPRLPPPGTPNVAPTHSRPPLYHSQPAQTVPPNPAAHSVNGGSGGGSVAATTPASHLTRAEQEAVMNSQKARLSRHDGRSRQGSGTPQPASGAHRAASNRAAAAASHVNGA